MAFLEGQQLSKTYRNAEVPVPVFSGLNLSVAKGEMLAIVGPSGIGKSTLLHLLGGLDRPDSGRVVVGAEEVTSMNGDALARFRNRNVGFVFQFHHLLPEFTAIENVAMPGWIARMKREEALDRAGALLGELGLQPRARHFPNQLSGGEQQRVAIARALLTDPVLFLADEPTGNLDPDLSLEIMNLFREINARGTTVLVATHDRELIRRVGRRTLTLDHGSVVEVT